MGARKSAAFGGDRSRVMASATPYFVFGNLQNVIGTATPSPAELALSNSLIDYWTHFAASGDPNTAGEVQWLPYDGANERTLQLDDTIAPINAYHATQCNYLQTLPPPTLPPF